MSIPPFQPVPPPWPHRRRDGLGSWGWFVLALTALGLSFVPFLPPDEADVDAWRSHGIATITDESCVGRSCEWTADFVPDSGAATQRDVDATDLDVMGLGVEVGDRVPAWYSWRNETLHQHEKDDDLPLGVGLVLVAGSGVATIASGTWVLVEHRRRKAWHAAAARS
ncbi:hypothetical protein [Aeromicrobium sp. IC_218]|uniref:hypothetical protein n=1 Tax=Aeromicrobium sp. IC_218 TaxID=2545468 RepID=UPI00103CFE7A|nr:hypothetical protein [Aeromicrobium sp. IC_218]TCI99842.1 hypothetical protein E0W78_05430 [Aeromicrobium sp. IC_218]